MRFTKIITIFLAALIIVGALAGCTSHQVLHETDTLRVERDGRSLVVYDLAGDATYTLATKRVRKTETPAEPKSLVETDTLTITAQPGLTTITDKTAGTIVTIGRRHR